MRTIPIIWHVVNPALPAVLPEAELRALFATAGIDLRFQRGVDYPFDPAHSATTYQSLSNDFRQNPTVVGGIAVGHLILGLRQREYPSVVAGELIDPPSRGLSVVYRRNPYVLQNGLTGLVQTCAHELGHLLNLAHVDVGADFPSAMHQANGRLNADIDLAWSAADIETQNRVMQGRPAYVYAPKPAPACNGLPFAHQARAFLTEFAPHRLLPWLGPFERPYDGSEDKLTPHSALTLRPEHGTHVEGGVFSYVVEIANTGGTALHVPGHIGPQFDNMILHVTRPDGTTYQHRPRSFLCGLDRQVLAPGETVRHHFCTIRGPKGAVFPTAGQYIARVSVPAIGMASRPIVIDVAPRTSGPLAEKNVRRRIADGGRWPPKLRARIAKAIAGKRLEQNTRAYLALMLARQEPDAAKKSRYRRRALERGAPQEVRHAAVLDEIQAAAGLSSPLQAARRVAAKHLRAKQDASFKVELLKRYQHP